MLQAAADGLHDTTDQRLGGALTALDGADALQVQLVCAAPAGGCQLYGITYNDAKYYTVLLWSTA
jgi:hypothetical protein